MNNDLISRSALLESMNAVVFRNVPVEHQPYVQVACEAFDAVTKTAPVVDAVEVVRCWDCKFSIGRLLDDDENDVNTWCNRWDNCVPACGYCHCGAKMMDGDVNACNSVQG